MLVLLDTNILLRLFERADPNYGDIRAVLTLSWGRGDELVTTPQNAIEYWNVSSRPVTARGGYGRSVAKTRARLAGIQRVCRMLTETEETFEAWKRTVIAHSIVGVSVHDARIVAQMRIWNVGTIVTLNPADFRRYPGIVVRTPREFLMAPP